MRFIIMYNLNNDFYFIIDTIRWEVKYRAENKVEARHMVKYYNHHYTSWN